MIESAWLHSFASFAEDANMSRAAKRLHLTQPAVHGHLRKLSEELGVRLYRRVGRALVLTPDGIEVAAFARSGIARDRELRARLKHQSHAEPLILAAGAGAIRYLIGDALPAFQRAEKVRIEVRALEASAAVLAVRSGDVHVGVGVLRAEPNDVACVELASIAHMLVLPRAHPLAKKRTVRLTDLARLPLVLPPEGRPLQQALAIALDQRGIEPIVGAVASGWEVTIKLVELGLGLGVVNAFCDIPKGLVKRPLHELAPVRYYVFIRDDARPLAKALVSSLLALQHSH